MQHNWLSRIILLPERGSFCLPLSSLHDASLPTDFSKLRYYVDNRLHVVFNGDCFCLVDTFTLSPLLIEGMNNLLSFIVVFDLIGFNII